ncbi:MAG TPA: hypothetical protein VGM32_10390 [Rhodopila sp.]
MRFAITAGAAVSGLFLLTLSFYGQPAVYLRQARDQWDELMDRPVADRAKVADANAEPGRVAPRSPETPSLGAYQDAGQEALKQPQTPQELSQIPDPATNPPAGAPIFAPAPPDSSNGPGSAAPAASPPPFGPNTPSAPAQSSLAEAQPDPLHLPSPAPPGAADVMSLPSTIQVPGRAEAELGPVKPEAAKTEPLRAEQAKADQAKPDQAKPDQAKPVQSKSERTNIERTKTERAKAEQGKTEQTKAAQAKPERAQVEPAKPEVAGAEQAKLEQPKPEPAKPEQARPEAPKPEPAKPGQPKPVIAAQRPVTVVPPSSPPHEEADDAQSVLARLRQLAPSPPPVDTPSPPEAKPRQASLPLVPRLNAARAALANGQIEDARRLLQQAQLQLVFGPINAPEDAPPTSGKGALDVAHALDALSANDITLSRRYIDVALGDLSGNPTNPPIQESNRRISGYAPAYPPR